MVDHGAITADVAIVGSGIAGALTAYRLAAAGLKIVVLEAGPRIDRAETVANYATTHKLDLSGIYPNTKLAPRPDQSDPNDNYLVNEGQDEFRPEYLRVVGGTTWHWSGASVRFLPSEFRMKSEYGVAVDWPITYEQIERYYTEAEYEMGVSGDVDLGSPRSRPFPMPPMRPTYLDREIMRRLEPHGIHFDVRPAARNSTPYDGRPECEGNNSCSPLCPIGAQYAAIVHVRKAEDLGVRVIDNTLVTHIAVDAESNVTGLTIRRPDGSTSIVSARAYVLACNGIETPRLMLASRAENTPHGVGNQNGLVGRYLMDHPGNAVRLVLPFPVYSGRGPEAIHSCYQERDGTFRRMRAGFTMAIYNHLNLHNMVDELLLKGHRPPDLDDLIEYRAKRFVEFDSHIESLPDAENRVRIDARRPDSSGMPGIVIDFRIDEYTRAALDRASILFRQIGQALNAEEISEVKPFGHHHLMGTTRMGRSHRDSVVDPSCRVHAHRNLFIAGSSVFPTGGTANPTLTIAALSLRLADAIAGELARQE